MSRMGANGAVVIEVKPITDTDVKSSQPPEDSRGSIRQWLFGSSSQREAELERKVRELELRLEKALAVIEVRDLVIEELGEANEHLRQWLRANACAASSIVNGFMEQRPPEPKTNRL